MSDGRPFLPSRLGPTWAGVALVVAAVSGLAGQTPRPDPLSGLDAYVERAMRAWQVPGVSLVVVRGDSILTRGYGLTAAGADPVDEHTLFGIGSLTKAFTATVLAMLVDEGALSWDDPVSKHLPDFAMHDPYVSRHLTIRDVLSHRTGLAGDDLMWVAGGRDASDLIHVLRFQQPAFGFRSGFGYHNIGYLVAGELAGARAGKPWGALVRERIFEPLGMKRSTADLGELRRRTNVALPHDEIGPGQLLGNAPSAKVPLDAPTTVRRIDWFEPDTAPAGGIGSSAADFGRWLRFQLGAGAIDGKRLVSEEVLIATRTPHIPSPGFPRRQSESSETNLSAYGMGWGLRDYRGRLMVSHLGSTPGWGSVAMLLPAERVGVAVFTNAAQAQWLADSVARWTLDRLLGAERNDWNRQALEWAEQRRQSGIAALRKAAAGRVLGTKPSLPLESYAGTYVDNLYPAARVMYHQDRLRLVLGPALAGDLDHWQDDVFRITWDRADFGANFVTFEVAGVEHPKAVRARILGREASWRRSNEPPGRTSEQVLDRGEPGHWDAHYVFGPNVFRHDGRWYMFYTGGGADGVAIGYATSPDGIRWTKAPANPVFAPRAGAGVPVVRVEDDGSWTLLYERTPRGRAIYRATAPGPDGPWTPQPEPVLESVDDAWDRLMFPTALFRAGDEWRLHYTGRTAIAEEPLEALPRTGLATSADGRTWRLHNDPATAAAPFRHSDPILAEGPRGTWDEHGIASSNPLRTEDGWELFYVGFPWAVLAPPTPGRGTLWLGHATSRDGIHWTRSSAGPVADTGERRFPLIHVVREEGQYLIYHDWRFGRGIGLIRLAGTDLSAARVAR